MLRYEETHPGSYYWFDPFSLNQHSETGVVETAVRPLLLAQSFSCLRIIDVMIVKGQVSRCALLVSLTISIITHTGAGEGLR